MDLGIAGRRAVVAASSSGLGLETARALGEAGCEVIVSGRSEDKLVAAVEAVPNSRSIVADLADAAGAEAFIDQARDMLGGIDILVTNNGGPPPGNFASTPVDAYQAALDLNLVSMIALCKATVPDMQEQKWGRVVAITSISVRQPIGILILSNTARAGYTGFLKTLALEVAADGVTVNSIQPGLHATDRLLGLYPDSAGADAAAAGLPAKTLGDPADFGRAAAFLCSESAKFITGMSLPVDGGQHAGLQ